MKKISTKQVAIPLQAVDKILVAAELAFAQSGFDGAGMKAISTAAEVSQALVHYHFGTKDRLYEAVIQRRSQKINDERHALLDQINVSSRLFLVRHRVLPVQLAE